MHSHLAILATLALVGSVMGDSAVTVLTPDNFDDVVGGPNPVLVEFYAPWCGHCKNLAPEYEIVASTFKPSDGVVVANLDADAHRDLSQKYGVTGFPTLKWFPKGSTDPEDYSGGRTADDLVSFINGKTGLSRKVKKPPTAVTVLDSDNFDAIVMDPSKDVLVEFYAPWCGHCKALAPVYEEVAKTYEAEPNVVVANLDADKHRDLAGQYEVTGFPTIKFFPRGADKEPEAYESGRDAESFVNFINDVAGTHRKVGGALTENAGRLADFDSYAKTFMAASKEDRKTILADSEAALDVLTDEEAVNGRFYTKAMAKVLKKGDSYIEKEIARLSGMLDSPSVSPKKKTLFMLRKNVLSAFADE